MSELAIAIPGFDSVQSYVRQRRELALRNPEAWAEAWHETYDENLNRAIFALMDETDDLNALRTVRQVLREQIIRAATQQAQDDLEVQL